MKIKNYYVENTTTCANEATFKSLKKAVAFCVIRKDTNLMIHVGGWNLDSYEIGDTTETLYTRCKKYLAELR